MTRFQVHWKYSTTLKRDELKKDIQSKDTLHLLDLDNIEILATPKGHQINCRTTTTCWDSKMIMDHIEIMYGSEFISNFSALEIIEPKDNMDVTVVMDKIRKIFPSASLETDNTGQAVIYTHCMMIQAFVEME